jgi:hypothetical protein
LGTVGKFFKENSNFEDGSALKVKVQELWRLKMESWRALELTIEAWRLKMEPWSVCKLVVGDSHHFDEEQEQDPNPDPH